MTFDEAFAAYQVALDRHADARLRVQLLDASADDADADELEAALAAEALAGAAARAAWAVAARLSVLPE